MRPRRRLAEFPLVWYSASTWIGIDGDGSPDVLQVGCDSDVLSFLGHHNAAIECVAGVVPRWIVLDQQFSGKPGRYDGLVICVDPGSTTAAEIYMLNTTNGAHASFAVTAPKGNVAGGKLCGMDRGSARN
jgi:hypothetical protein